MEFLFRSLPKLHRRRLHHHQRRFISDAPVKWVRDRGLDHAVEREKNLKPVLNLKNLLKSEPSKSLPITLISQHKHSLKIPTRPIDFIRKYPSIFHEFLPGGVGGVHPHIKLTPEALDLDAEEDLVYQSENFREESADRLLKLLMMTRIHKIPLSVIDELKWDLGLPQDYVKSLVPEFPDCFRVAEDDKRVLELVCWSEDLAISVLEKRAMNSDSEYSRGMPIAFPMQFSRNFEMDKNMKKWVDDWQKLPYISPYENAAHLQVKSDESDKWAAAVLHELLNVFVPKKAERESLLFLGEYLGIRSRFKRALVNHPGVFYMSNKIGTYTVVLRDAFKRDLLVERNALMNMRYQYVHLMNTVKEDRKGISVPGGNAQQEKEMAGDSEQEGEEDEEDESDKEHEGEMYESSDAEVEDASDDDHDDDDEEDEDESESLRGVGRKFSNNGGRTSWKQNSDVRGISRNLDREKSSGKHHDSLRGVGENVSNNRGRTSWKQNSDVRGISRNLGREKSSGKHHENLRGVGENVSNNRGRTSWKLNSDVRGISRNLGREKSSGKHHGGTQYGDTRKGFGRTEKHRGDNVRGRSSERSSNYSKKRDKLLTEKRSSI